MSILVCWVLVFENQIAIPIKFFVAGLALPFWDRCSTSPHRGLGAAIERWGPRQKVLVVLVLRIGV
eukprot:4820506-Heterocapsa_arctica.AAC.1